MTRTAGLAALCLVLAACLPQAAPSPSPTVTSSPTVTTSPGPATTPPPTSPGPSPSPTGSAVPGRAVATSVPLPSFAQISARLDGLVWALVGGVMLFRSTDAGMTWEQRPLPAADLGSPEISFVSEREGWIMSLGSPGTGCQAQDILLWRTTDAGATYEQVPATGIGAQGCKRSLSFVDPQRGFVVASPRDIAAVIYRTADGGRTWAASSPIASPRSTSYVDVGIVRAFGSELLVEVAGVRDDPGHAVYRSTDGGATWSVLVAIPTLDPVAFLTRTRWIQLIAPGQSRETSDGGVSWQALESDYQQAAPVAAAVVFGDPSVGYATVRGTIQRTVNGGQNWTLVRTPGTR